MTLFDMLVGNVQVAKVIGARKHYLESPPKPKGRVGSSGIRYCKTGCGRECYKLPTSGRYERFCSECRNEYARQLKAARMARNAC